MQYQRSYIVLYSTLLYSTLLYSTLLYSTLLYSTLLYSTMLYHIALSLYYTPAPSEVDPELTGFSSGPNRAVLGLTSVMRALWPKSEVEKRDKPMLLYIYIYIERLYKCMSVYTYVYIYIYISECICVCIWPFQATTDCLDHGCAAARPTCLLPLSWPPSSPSSPPLRIRFPPYLLLAPPRPTSSHPEVGHRGSSAGPQGVNDWPPFPRSQKPLLGIES